MISNVELACRKKNKQLLDAEKLLGKKPSECPQ